MTRRDGLTPEELAHKAAATPLTAGESSTRRRLSWLRVGAVFGALLLLAGIGVVVVRVTADDASAVGSSAFFAPYVDVTVTPQFAFEDPTQTAANETVLSFVVSSQKSACVPSWGGAYSLDEGSSALDLDRRIDRVRQRGGDVIVSFGGVANSELSVGCTDATDLESAYRGVITRYSLKTIDLDIEGDAASAPEVNARRAAAMAALQADQTAAGHPIAVWLTLPVGPDGLTSTGLTVLDSMLSAGVDVAGVNALTMDYGQPVPSGSSMADIAESSLRGLSKQVSASYAKANQSIDGAALWQHIGATPMIGQNDTPSERFELTDAEQLVAFMEEHHGARLSMWSANRDKDCGPNYADTKVVSNLCSGVEQDPGAFTKIFLTFGEDGAVPAAASGGSSSVQTSGRPSGTPSASISDDPATSPYPIWNEVQAYPAGTKVVWHHNVYQAKWYTQGDVPDAPVESASDTPWVLIGPVLPGEHPAPTPTLPLGTYPVWSPNKAYVAGSKVLYKRVGYQAKWYTKGDVPDAITPDPAGSPWRMLTTSASTPTPAG